MNARDRARVVPFGDFEVLRDERNRLSDALGKTEADRDRLENTLKLIRKTAVNSASAPNVCESIASFANRALIDDSWNPLP